MSNQRVQELVPAQRQTDDVESIKCKELEDMTNVQIHTGEADNEEYREGGKGWLVILGCGLGSFTGFGMINTYGAFQTHYETVLFPDVKSARLSLIGACQASFLYFFTPLFIPLVYSFGIRQVLICGCSLMIVGLFGLSSTSEGQLWKCYLFQAVMYSLGSAMIFTSVMMSPLEWFKRRRATAFAVNFIFVGLGGIIWPLIFKNMIHKKGFQWTVRTIAFIYIAFSVGIVLLIPQRLDEKYIHKEETISNSKWDTEKIRNLPNRYLHIFAEWYIVLQDWRFALLLISNTIGAFGVYPAIFYLDLFGEIIAPDHRISSNLVVMYNALGVPGRLIPALLADNIGRTNVLMVWIGSAGISVLAVWIPSINGESINVYTAFVVLFGFFAGAYFSLFPACIGQLFGIKGSEARFGLYMMLATPGPLAGSVIAGSFIPENSSATGKIIHSFYSLTIFSGVMIIICALGLLAVRLSISRKPLVFV